jgi:hypothetical protein
MSDTTTVADLTDHERRWLVHIFAALQEHIQDELEHDSIPYHDASLLADAARVQRLWQYVANEWTQCMHRVHPEEAARVAPPYL